MIEDHVHCGECQAVIPLTRKDPGGVRHPVEVAIGYQWRIGVDPLGNLGPVQVPVPLCPPCHGNTTAKDEKAKTSRLVVAPAGSIPKPL